MIVTLGAIKHKVYQHCTRGCTLAASLPFNRLEITQAIIARVAYKEKRSKEPIIGVPVNSRLQAGETVRDHCLNSHVGHRIRRTPRLVAELPNQ